MLSLRINILCTSSVVVSKVLVYDVWHPEEYASLRVIIAKIWLVTLVEQISSMIYPSHVLSVHVVNVF